MTNIKGKKRFLQRDIFTEYNREGWLVLSVTTNDGEWLKGLYMYTSKRNAIQDFCNKYQRNNK